jgi:hypothetical protein
MNFIHEKHMHKAWKMKRFINSTETVCSYANNLKSGFHYFHPEDLSINQINHTKKLLLLFEWKFVDLNLDK